MRAERSLNQCGKTKPVCFGFLTMDLEEARKKNLEVLARLCTSVHQLNDALEGLGDKISKVNSKFSTVEKRLDAVSLPFHKAVFEATKGDQAS